MATPAPVPPRRAIRFLPFILFLVALAVLWFVHQANPRPSQVIVAPSPESSTTTVTGPNNEKVPLSTAVHNGWVTMAVQPKTSDKVQLSNHTKIPIRLETNNQPAVELPAGGNTTVASPQEMRPALDTAAQTATTINTIGMPTIVSLVLLVACLFVILARRFEAADKHWAYATVGSIVGFWLKS